MERRARLLTATFAVGLAVAGIVTAQTEQAPVEAQPEPQPQAPAAPADPVAEILIRQAQEDAQRATEALNRGPPIVINTQPAPAAPSAAETPETSEEAAEQVEEAAESVETLVEPEGPPPARQRRPVAIVQALDKTTAETMRFEVRVGGPPVRFRNALIFTARACEVNAPEDPQEEAAAFLEIRSQPRGTSQATQARDVFRGWMFASAPAVNPLEHPNYDAWVVGCRA